MSTTETQPLSGLAATSYTARERARADRMSHSGHYDKSYDSYGNTWAWAFLCFIILVIIVWIILWVTCPDFLRKDRDCDDRHDHHDRHDDDNKCCDVDGGKTLLCAIVIALIILVIIWVIYAAYAGWGGQYHQKRW